MQRRSPHTAADTATAKGKQRKKPEAKHALFHKFCGNPNACGEIQGTDFAITPLYFRNYRIEMKLKKIS
jgi:hypothetical protein